MSSVESRTENFEREEYAPDINYFVERYACDYTPNPLQPLEEYKKRIAHRLKKTFIDDFHILREGYCFIGKYNEMLKEHLKVSSEIQKTLKNLVQVQAALKEGKTFQDLLSWSDEDVQEIYHLATVVYDKQEYYESSCIYKLLCTVQPNFPVFWLGGGDALAAENRYDEALVSYFGGLNINPYDFDLYLGICQVLCKLHQYNEAIQIIEGAQSVVLTTGQSEKVEELPILKEKLSSMHELISSYTRSPA